ncbi:hypothetical protein INR49_016145, partial [Caranx melampygus]
SKQIRHSNHSGSESPYAEDFLTDAMEMMRRSFDTVGFRHAVTMAFAIDEINKNSNLLPNVTLGYSLYDNCGALIIGFSGALSLASGQEERFLLQNNCLGTPPVVGIVRAMIQILKHYGWTWVGLLVSGDDYGLHVAQSFQADLGPSGGGCLAYIEILPWSDNPAELRRIVVRQNVTGLQWVASEAWTTFAALQTPRLMPYLGGTLGIAIRRGELPGLREFLLQIRPEQHESWIEAGGALCSGQETLENVETDILDLSNLRPEYNIYKAVYSLAYALDNMLQCEPGRGPFSGNSCATLETLEPWQPPRSVCSESCPPGTRMARKKGEPECCFDCIPCSEGKISNETGFSEQHPY